MKVGFDAKRFFYNKTGLGNYSRSIVNALAENYPNDEFLLLNAKHESIQLPFPNLGLIHPQQAGKLWRILGMGKIASRAGLNVFHGLSNELPLDIKSFKNKKVVTIHDVIFKRYPNYYPLIDRSIYHLKTKHAVKSADVIVATSKATADDLVRFYQADESKIKVVYQPVHESWYQSVKTNREFENPYYVYVSSFNQRKNHGALVQAFALIHKQTDLNLVLAGSYGETSNTIKNFIESEKLQNRVFIVENPAQDRLVSIVKNAAAFVYPSLFEGFGIPLAEAAVCGLPVAASDISVFTELAEKSALYFHPNKPESIADAMLSIVDPEKQFVLNLHRDALLQKIDKANIAKDLMNVYLG